MKSNNESNILAKIENFEKLIALAEEYGKIYQPKDKKISLDELKKIQEKANENLTQFREIKNKFSLSNSEKALKTKTINNEVSRIFLGLKGAGVKKSEIEDARNLTSIFRNQKKSKVNASDSETEATKTSKTHKRSVSFYDKLEKYEALYDLLSRIEEYSPNEEFLNLESISERLNEMKELHKSNSKLELQLDEVRKSRDRIFKAEDTGLTALGRQSKSYMKSIFGAGSIEAKQLSKLKFR
jgi:hypothetical protein